jgi:hypothetical protein
MRSLGKAVLAILALVFAPAAVAQEAAPLPKAPVPYTKIAPKPQRRRRRRSR